MDEEYIPLNLWIKQDQMNFITREAYEQSTTIYSIIRRALDFYSENKKNKTNESILVDNC